MNLNSVIFRMERRIRASREYDEWVIRHKAPFCIRCTSAENLECHHIIDLYHMMLGLWKLYGDEKQAIEHGIAMHEDDLCEAVTLCHECHGKLHPGRQRSPKGDTRVEEWSVIPRGFQPGLAHSTRDSRKDALNLVALQTVFGIGWYILNGHMDCRMIDLNRRRLAQLLGKQPGTSFNLSLDRALPKLVRAGVLLGHHRKDNSVELHISPKWLADLQDNPWFVSLEDIRTGKMCVLVLRWFLGFQCRKRQYRIGLTKLRGHLGIRTAHMPMAAKAVKSACKDVSWAKIEIEHGVCTFTLKKRGATPIFSLRNLMDDSVEYGC